MIVVPFDRALRLAFVAAPELELHFPSRCRWADARFVATAPHAWAAIADELAAFAPDVSIVAGVQEAPVEELARIPGVKIGWVAGPLRSADDVRLLGARLGPPPGQGAIDFLAWFEEPPPDAAALPVLATFPPPVDVARALAAPRLDALRVLVPAWARPPAAVLAGVRAAVDVVEVPTTMAPSTWPSLLAEAGILVYSSRATLGRLDPLPLLAMANGLCVVASTAFPSAWGIEAEDEYLVRPEADALAAAVAEIVRYPEAARAVRVRAWQRARETFSADDGLRRLVHDALLFAQSNGVVPIRAGSSAPALRSVPPEGSDVRRRA